MNRVTGVAIAAVLFGGFGIGAWLYFEGYLGKREEATDTVPVVEPLAGPIRERPDDPGGYQADHRESPLLEGTDATTQAGPERLLPSHEEPVPRPRPGSSPPPPDGPTAMVLSAGEGSEPEEGAEVTLVEPPELPKPRHPRSAWKAAIQMLAVRAPDRAVVEAQRLLAAHPDVFGTLDFRIRVFNVSEQERVHRLQAGPFESRKDAGAVCNVLEKRGVACFVAKGQ